jgi:L-ascorbate metabolism protein UlaG (beta-lactamase superfamily)
MEIIKMKIPHFIKVINYMYQLNSRNFKLYFKPTKFPEHGPIMENSVHWVGHSTTVINLYNNIIVTDPVLSNYLGYIKRMVKPSTYLNNLNTNYILISHGHMDHLDINTLLKLDKNSTVIVPPQYRQLFKLIGFAKVIPLRHSETYSDNDVSITCVKALHDGRRYYIGKNTCSNSYVIKCKDKSVLYAGDTAFTDVYKNISVDAAIMPVGCYKPVEYEKMHCTPMQSFEMFKMMKSKIMIPVHYKTFILAQDEDYETENILSKINDGTIKIINIGETVTL